MPDRWIPLYVGFQLFFVIFTGALLLLFVRDLIRAVRDERIGKLTGRERVLAGIGAAGVLNFCTFVFVGALLGGDALSGRVQNGHYFLGSHGSYTEVSRWVFVYSACHGYSALIGMLAAFAAGQEFHHPRWWR